MGFPESVRAKAQSERIRRDIPDRRRMFPRWSRYSLLPLRIEELRCGWRWSLSGGRSGQSEMTDIAVLPENVKRCFWFLLELFRQLGYNEHGEDCFSTRFLCVCEWWRQWLIHSSVKQRDSFSVSGIAEARKMRTPGHIGLRFLRRYWVLTKYNVRYNALASRSGNHGHHIMLCSEGGEPRTWLHYAQNVTVTIITER